MQEAYYHEWDLDEHESLAKKDVQIVAQVLTACQKLLKLDQLDDHDALQVLHVNMVWALMGDA